MYCCVVRQGCLCLAAECGAQEQYAVSRVKSAHVFLACCCSCRFSKAGASGKWQGSGRLAVKARMQRATSEIENESAGRSEVKAEVELTKAGGDRRQAPAETETGSLSTAGTTEKGSS